MKHYILIPVLAFTINCAAQTMIQEGNEWSYCTAGYNSWTPERTLCELTFERYFINGEHEAEGKVYKDVWVEVIKYEAILQENEESDTSPVFVLSDHATHMSPEFHIGVREEGGRVYTNANEYNQSYWDGDLGEFNYNAWHPIEENEYVMYDFNDPSFPHTSPFLLLSGYNPEVIPYVGNTGFLFIVPDAATDGIVRETNLNLFFRQGSLEYQSPNFRPDPFFPDVAPENEYHPFIEDGKVWLVGDFPRGGQMPDAILTYYFDGDTIVGGHLCRRWMLDVKTSDRLYIHHNIWGSHTSLLAPVFEENSKVWFFRKGEDEPRLLYDFTGIVSEEGFSVGSCEYGFDTKCYVDFVGTDDYRNGLRYVSVHDDLMLEEMTPEVREWFDAHKGDCGDYWTTMGYRWYEGIGTLLAPDLNVPHYRGEYRKVLRVTVGEDIIYENEDANDILTAICGIENDSAHRTSVNPTSFDLWGRKVSLSPNPSPKGDGRKLPRGVYIKDGKKVVVK